MPNAVSVNMLRTFMGRASHGADLVTELTDFCSTQDIALGRVEAIGALKQACVGFYDQQTHSYNYVSIDRPVEITNMIGNVSIKEGTPIVHAHLTVSDEKGNAFGGHLAQGNVVFACEFVLYAFSGKRLERTFDSTTGLPLWDTSQMTENSD